MNSLKDKVFIIGSVGMSTLIPLGLILKSQSLMGNKTINIAGLLVAIVSLIIMAVYGKLAKNYRLAGDQKLHWWMLAIPGAGLVLNILVPYGAAEYLFLWGSYFLMWKWFYLDKQVGTGPWSQALTYTPIYFFVNLYALSMIPWEEKRDLYFDPYLCLVAWMSLATFASGLIRSFPKNKMIVGLVIVATLCHAFASFLPLFDIHMVTRVGFVLVALVFSVLGFKENKWSGWYGGASMLLLVVDYLLH